MSEKYFGVPFAASGDKTVIPVAAQPSGAVSFTQGFGIDYERNPATDPAAKRIPRDETNRLYYDITNEIGILQRWGAPDWIPASLNDGSPVSYGIGAVVRYGGVRYESLVASNTVEPGTDATKWMPVTPYSLNAVVASTAEVTGAVLTSKFVTPFSLAAVMRSGAMIGAAATRSGTNYTVDLPGATAGGARAQIEFTAPDNSPAGPLTINVDGTGAFALLNSTGGQLAAGDLVSGRTYLARSDGASWVLVNPVASQFVSAGAASETTAGITRYATAAEANALSLLTVALTPGRLPLSTTTQQGVVRMATNSEAAAGASATIALSPASAAPLFGALTPTSRSLTAGSGLTGGGNLTADRTFSLGTPSTITGSSGNSVSGATHTHALSIGVADVSGLQPALDGKASLNADVTFAAINYGTAGARIYPAGGSGSALVLRSGTPGAYKFIIFDETGNAAIDGAFWNGSSRTWDTTSLPMATAAQYRAGTSGNLALTPAQVWAAAALVTLTQAATIPVDMSAGINFTTTMTGNRTLGTPSNAKPGQSGVIEILQDGTGGRTLAFASGWVFAGGTPPTLSTAANARDVLAYTVLSSGVVLGNLLKGVA